MTKDDGPNLFLALVSMVDFSLLDKNRYSGPYELTTKFKFHSIRVIWWRYAFKCGLKPAKAWKSAIRSLHQDFLSVLTISTQITQTTPAPFSLKPCCFLHFFNVVAFSIHLILKRWCKFESCQWCVVVHHFWSLSFLRNCPMSYNLLASVPGTLKCSQLLLYWGSL